MRKHRGSIVAGIILIGIGAWLLAERLGVQLPGINALWPALVILLGIASFADYFYDGRQDTDKVFFGMAATLVGGFFFQFTLGKLEWAQMRVYWPVFVLIFSAASFAQWLAAPSKRGVLIPATVGLAVGLFFMATNLNLLGPNLSKQISQLWPVALILLGLIVLVRAFRRGG
ncbi:MAG: hypothetical protein FJ030_15250 [Chloroflexi bacterium]|nr:hypothetical protein [Chloroflexota bacterium]